ncbi:hybrid sensor histidine kinase/response regulator [Salinirussus salinus]|uniref:hybrid sensor histidine kinase/response regulator n=1 Tax=Salinirussus salinus TaxID=1198300 RepID=UPI00135B81ED|nr:GAF domain-containing protein [Salinirussus salinus]
MTAVVRVLLVDDEPDLADVAATFLEREDERFTVDTATGAEEALSALTDREVDCIVSDYDMPGQNGIDLLESVREDYPDLPFVLFTGKGSEEVASDAISAGVTDYLQKETGTSQYAVLANRVGNVVEQYRSRRELEASQKRLSLFIEQSPLGVLEYDSDFEIVRVNEAGEEILGYSEAELRGETWEALVTEDSYDDVDEVTSALAAGEGGYHSVDENVRKDGERIVCEWHNRVVTDDGGEVVAVFSLFQDVTERERRQQKLDELQGRTQLLMETETVEETVRVATEAADDLIGAPLSGVHLLNDAGDALEPAAVVGGVYDAFDELPSYPMDGPEGSRAELVWDVFRSSEPRRIGDTETYEPLTEPTPARSVLLYPIEGHGVFVVSSDEPHAFTDTDETLSEILATTLTTALDRVEQANRRRESLRRLERLHDATLSLMQAEGDRAVADRAVEEAESVLGFPLAMVRLYDPDEDGLVPVASSDRVDEVFEDRPVFGPDDGSVSWEAFESGELTLLDDIGRHDRAVDAGTPLQSLMVVPVGERGLLSAGATEPATFDETDAFLAQILATAMEAAFERVDRRAELERKNDRLEEFANAVSHDLRNPLNVATARLELAADDCDSHHLGHASDALDRMETLIGDILTLARQGREAVDPEPVGLEGVVRQAWGDVATADAALTVRDTATIEADPSQLRQLVGNLLGNAVEHGSTSPRSQAPEDSADVTVRVGTLSDDEGFYVADDGPGIPAEEREAVFDAGYSTAEGGVGFGLAIVERVADAHGWEVRVTEGSDGGARFEVSSVAVVGD